MDFLIERKCTDDMLDEVIVFRGEVRISDLARLCLDAFDHALIEDISSDAKATPADYLMGLEMIFRKHAEQVPNAKAVGLDAAGGQSHTSGGLGNVANGGTNDL